mmetsp:Transcript_57012/g.137827  ORF Transcript_57012/g.137827 Transcript_57012/m.137827 type:complete len:290 (-) Transcript_57012:884-1753(-)
MHGQAGRDRHLQVQEVGLPRPGAEGHRHRPRAPRPLRLQPGRAGEPVCELRDAVLQRCSPHRVWPDRPACQGARPRGEALGEGSRPVPRRQRALVPVLLDLADRLFLAGRREAAAAAAAGALLGILGVASAAEEPRAPRAGRGRRCPPLGAQRLHEEGGGALQGLRRVLRLGVQLAHGGRLRAPGPSRATRRLAAASHRAARGRGDLRGWAEHRGPLRALRQPRRLHHGRHAGAPPRGVQAGRRALRRRRLAHRAPGALGPARGLRPRGGRPSWLASESGTSSTRTLPS